MQQWHRRIHVDLDRVCATFIALYACQAPYPTLTLPNVQATSALTALCAVLATDPSGAAAEAVYCTSLPSRILADLAEAPHKALTQARTGRLLRSGFWWARLRVAADRFAYAAAADLRVFHPSSPLQPPPRGQALLLVVEGQLTLLLRLALTGPAAQRAAAAQRLFALHALPRLSQCRALDLQPEEPGFGQYSGEALGLAYRLPQHVVDTHHGVLLAAAFSRLAGAASCPHAKWKGATMPGTAVEPDLTCLSPCAIATCRRGLAAPAPAPAAHAAAAPRAVHCDGAAQQQRGAGAGATGLRAGWEVSAGLGGVRLLCVFLCRPPFANPATFPRDPSHPPTCLQVIATCTCRRWRLWTHTPAPSLASCMMPPARASGESLG